MQAVILAGGKGTRLRPYTMCIPKPLVQIGQFPILEIIIRQLKYYRINNIIISTGYLSELIESYFKKGDRWGVKIHYIKEKKALGTAGAIKNINDLEENFLLMNGDILTNINYRKLYDFHIKHKKIATIALVKREISIDFGVIKSDKSSKLIDYIEKPKYFNYVSMGIYMLNKRCRDYIFKGEYLGFPELILRVKSDKKDIYCYKTNSYWLDIGRIEDFQKAQFEFEKNKKKFLYGKR